MGKELNLDHPKDLNEKINWLKFHADQHLWAKYADKSAVREYIAERGLSDVLTTVYGKWDSIDGVMRAWDSLPDEFVLKSNNGCGNLIIVSKENGGKENVNPEKLRKTLKKWFQERDFCLEHGEFHYQYIKNCVFAEQLLRSDDIKTWSASVVDYKIWCFNGEPFGCLVVYDRKIGEDGEKHTVDFYDLNWVEHTDYMSDKTPRHPIPKPNNWEQMLDVARIIGEGIPQVRVDLYNIDGRIYFGEMTMTSQGGYMNYFGEDLLIKMGSCVKLNE